MDVTKEKYGVVGFTVQFSKRLVDMKEPGAVLQFDRVLSNVNGCYNPATGIFTVSRTGIYSFYFSGVADADKPNDYVDLAIEKRRSLSHCFDHTLARIFVKPYGEFLLGCQGSSSVRVKLLKGEQVLVRHVRGDLVLKGGCHTTFSGVLEIEYADNA